MQDRIDALMAAGAENMWPKFTLFIPRTADKPAQHVVVAEIVDGACYLTAEGKDLLETKQPDIVDAEIVSTKPKRAKKQAVVVEDSNEIVDDIDIVLELFWYNSLTCKQVIPHAPGV